MEGAGDRGGKKKKKREKFEIKNRRKVEFFFC